MPRTLTKYLTFQCSYHAGPSCHRPRTCRGGGDKHWFGTFHFDRWFVHAESVRETWQLHHDNAPAHSSQIIPTFLVKYNIPVVRQAPYSPDLALWNFWLFPPPENAAERDSIWVMRRHYTEHDGQAVLHSQRGIPEMLRTMAEPLVEVCSITRRLLRRV